MVWVSKKTVYKQNLTTGKMEFAGFEGLGTYRKPTKPVKIEIAQPVDLLAAADFKRRAVERGLGS